MNLSLYLKKKKKNGSHFFQINKKEFLFFHLPMQKQTKLFILVHQSINKYIHFQLHHQRSQESLILQKYHFLLYKFKPLSIASQKLKIITCFCYILRVQYLIIKQHKNILKGTKKWAKTF